MNARTHDGRTPLMAAAEFGATECATVLVEKGAYCLDLDAHEYLDSGFTALYWAAFRGNNQVVSLLLHAGANPRMINLLGETALETAQARGHQECVALLEAALAEPQRPRVLFKARALIDSARTIDKAFAEAQRNKSPRVAFQQAVLAAAPPYLKGRVADSVTLP